MTQTTGFNAAVADWLNKRHPLGTVAEVTDVRAHGSDWAGDTEGGFYDTFEVTVRWTTPDGEAKWHDVKGEEMADLWRFVMGAWPT